MERRDVRAKDEHRARDEQNVLEHAREREDKAAPRADKEDSGDVEQKRDRSVAYEDERAVRRGCCQDEDIRKGKQAHPMRRSS